MNKLFKFIFLITLSVGLMFNVPTVSAHQDPVACNASGLQEFPSISPSTDVHAGDTLTYSIIYANLDPDGAGPVAPCNVTGANATITKPNGTVLNVLTNATLNVGDTLTCPGSAGCAAGPYTYVVNSANENGSGDVVTNFHIAGILHQNASDNLIASDDDNLSSHVIHPSTVLTKTPSATVVLAGTNVTYTYTEHNDGDVVLTSPSVTDDKCSPVTYSTGDTNSNGKLDPGETWTYTCTMAINANTTNTALGHGTDPLGKDVTWCANTQTPGQGVFCDQDERSQSTVTVAHPSTITSIDSSATDVNAGDSVTLTVTERNDGDVNLTNAHVDVDNGVGTFNSSSANFSGDDGDGVLEPGETWTWTKSVVVNSATTFTATGHGTDPFTNDVTYPNDPEERDSVTVNTKALGCTLTQGYWKNHESAWTVSSLMLGTVNYTKTQLLSIFGQPVKGNGLVSLAHQLIAAKLNIASGATADSATAQAISDADALIGSLVVPPVGSGKLSTSQVSALVTALDNFNTGVTGPGHCSQ